MIERKGNTARSRRSSASSCSLPCPSGIENLSGKPETGIKYLTGDMNRGIESKNEFEINIS